MVAGKPAVGIGGTACRNLGSAAAPGGQLTPYSEASVGFTLSPDRHGLDTNCAMVGRSDKESSVSFSVGHGGFPFGAFLFCQASKNSLLHNGNARSLGRVDGRQLRKAG